MGGAGISQGSSEGTPRAPMHHKIVGAGAPAIVFVHGFGCSHTDWNSQVEHFSRRHTTVAVDLPGHGATPGPASPSSIERCGAEVARLLRALALPPAILIGHSLGCRVVLEATLQVPGRVAGIALVDGSRFAPQAVQAFEARFAKGEYKPLLTGMFEQMFTARSDPRVIAAALQRALDLPEAVGKPLLLSLAGYDQARLGQALERAGKPLLVLQTTYTNEKRERSPMQAGQTTPYLDFVRATVPAAHIEVLADIGHFPQLDAPAQTNAALARFVATLT
jgi:pimeloyl-ACP methyl ester carboxylesterase